MTDSWNMRRYWQAADLFVRVRVPRLWHMRPVMLLGLVVVPPIAACNVPRVQGATLLAPLDPTRVGAQWLILAAVLTAGWLIAILYRSSSIAARGPCTRLISPTVVFLITVWVLTSSTTLAVRSADEVNRCLRSASELLSDFRVLGLTSLRDGREVVGNIQLPNGTDSLGFTDEHNRLCAAIQRDPQSFFNVAKRYDWMGGFEIRFNKVLDGCRRGSSAEQQQFDDLSLQHIDIRVSEVTRAHGISQVGAPESTQFVWPALAFGLSVVLTSLFTSISILGMARTIRAFVAGTAAFMSIQLAEDRLMACHEICVPIMISRRPCSSTP